MKELLERRALLVAQMKALTDTAEEEKRAMSEEEDKKFHEMEAEVRAIDRTIENYNAQRKLGEPARQKLTETNEDKRQAEERAFEAYLRGSSEERAAANMDFGTNGAVVPASIANKIVEKVKEICPIYSMADIYNVRGTLTIPYYEAGTDKITMAYADEFKELESSSGKFGNITLNGYLAGALTLVSKSLINNSQFDIVSYVIQKMAEAIAVFIEHELLEGTSGKVEGLSGAKQIVTAAAASAITADELIDLQEMVPDMYQGSAAFIMNKATRTAIRKLKDGQGNYLLNRDFAQPWGYTLLGRPVYVSDNMPALAAGKSGIIYGDMKGLALKVSESMEIQTLLEKYATQHAIGVCGWVEFDAKIEDQQRIAVLKMAGA